MNKDEVRAALDKVGGFRRKPMTWGEVGLPVPAPVLAALPKYQAAELGIGHSIAAYFTTPPVSPVFLVVYQGGLYLVNTEGADYARYVRYVGLDNTEPAANRSDDDWAADLARYDAAVVAFYKTRVLAKSDDPTKDTSEHFALAVDDVSTLINAALETVPSRDIRDL